MEITERDQEVIERVRKELLSGKSFAYAAESQRSRDRMNCLWTVTSDQYSKLLRVLSDWARQGDRDAATVDQILPKINLYGTEAQALVTIAEVLGDIVRNGYFDVVGATGPEAGRRSQHHKPTTEREAIRLEVLYLRCEAVLDTSTVARAGWVLSALGREYGINTELTGRVF